MSFEDFMYDIDNEGYKNWLVPHNYVMGAGMTLGYKTVFGPIEIELSKANFIKTWTLFVNVGYWF